MIDRKPLGGKVLRVYLAGGGSRDFNAQKVDVAPDGSILLTRIESTGKEIDIKTAREAEGFRQTLLAIIGPAGEIRLETVDLAQEAGSGLD